MKYLNIVNVDVNLDEKLKIFLTHLTPILFETEFPKNHEC